MDKDWKFILAIPLVGLFLVSLFYPLDLIIPEGFWPFIPDIFLHFPLLYFFNQIVPGIFWLGFFTVGVLMLKWVIDD